VSLSDYSSFLTITKEQVEKVLEKIDQLKRLPPPLKISVERAKEGDAESCNDLGRWCFIHPVEIHPKYSCTLFASAIMGGYVPAKCNLGYYYQYSGRSLPSLIMAKQLYFDSVTAFPPYAPGINVLGLLYLKDQGREKLSFKEKQNLLAQAARLFTMGAMQLHEPACMHNLAYCYANGYGVARSIEKATQLHSDAIMLPPNEELKHLIPGVLSYYSREDVVYFP
jgi:TPR repeat protein